jgi:RecJ-like exonuclease
MTKAQEMTMDIAVDVLGISPESTPTDILSRFEEIWKTSPETPEMVIMAKNLLLQDKVSSQLMERRYFEIVSPFEASCVRCKGTGEIYKLEWKTIKVDCHACSGTGVFREKMGTCGACSGTGRFIRKYKNGGGINIVCRECKGTKKAPVKVKCQKCLGSGKKEKHIPSGMIKSTTPCPKCSELGFIPLEKLVLNTSASEVKPKKKPFKKKSKKAENPVISSKVAAGLTEMIQQAKSSGLIADE